MHMPDCVFPTQLGFILFNDSLINLMLTESLPCGTLGS